MTDHAVSWGRRRYADSPAIAVRWDFAVRGGSFGEADATAFAEACAAAVAERLPLVSELHSGGTRLQEGMRALVGIPRAVLALDTLADAGLPHVAVCGQPTTGGVWVAVGSGADLRVGTTGATVGFSGPRVVTAMTGEVLPPGANSAESAAAAGLLDAVVPAGEADTWVGEALAVLAPDDPRPVPATPRVAATGGDGWEHVQRGRQADRPDGVTLLDALLDRAVPLSAPDDTAAAALGRVAGRRVAAVALAAHRGGRPTPAAYRLLTRAAELADRLDLALVTLVDTPGADPRPASELAGIAATMREAMRAVLRCGAPTVAVVHGEGGSGGALAAAVTDTVAVGPHGWFAALGPEGAAAALRRDVADAVAVMDVTPADLVAVGVADDAVPGDPVELRAWVATALDRTRAVPAAQRLARRHARWGHPVHPLRPD